MIAYLFLYIVFFLVLLVLLLVGVAAAIGFAMWLVCVVVLASVERHRRAAVAP